MENPYIGCRHIFRVRDEREEVSSHIEVTDRATDGLDKLQKLHLPHTV